MKVPKIIIHTFLIVGLLFGNKTHARDSTSISTDTLPHFRKLYTIQQRYLHWVDQKNREFPMGLPVVSGNKYDGVLVGAALINLRQPVKHIDFTGVLMYGTKSKKVAGIANLDYHIQPKNSIIREIKPGIHFWSFSYNNFMFPTFKTAKALKYYKVTPEISIRLTGKKDKSQNISHLITFKSSLIYKKDASWTIQEGDSISAALIDYFLDKFYENQLSYLFSRSDKNYPVTASLSLRQAKQFVKMNLEFNSMIRYGLKDYPTGFHIRFFMGWFLYRNANAHFRYYPEFGYALSGRTGENDYLMDNAYFGRNEQTGFAAQQIAAQDGFFKVITPLYAIQVGQTIDFMMATNFVLDFPVKYVPVKFFFDFGYAVDNHLNPDNFLPVKGAQFDGGFMFSFLDRGIEFYFPVFMSKDFKNYYKSNLPKFKQRITFSIDLTKIALYKKIRTMKF